jgi:hypothetical protein
MTTPNLGLPTPLANTSERENFVRVATVFDAFLKRVPTANINVTDFPATPADGDVVLIGDGATGGAATLDGRLAIFLGASNGWFTSATLNALGPIDTESGPYIQPTTGNTWIPDPNAGGTSISVVKFALDNTSVQDLTAAEADAEVFVTLSFVLAPSPVAIMRLPDFTEDYRVSIFLTGASTATVGLELRESVADGEATITTMTYDTGGIIRLEVRGINGTWEVYAQNLG